MASPRRTAVTSAAQTLPVSRVAHWSHWASLSILSTTNCLPSAAISSRRPETSRSPRTPQRYSPRACAKFPCWATTASVPNTSYSPFSTPTNPLVLGFWARRSRWTSTSPSADRQASCRASSGSRIFGAETPHHQPERSGTRIVRSCHRRSRRTHRSMGAQHDPLGSTHAPRRSRDRRRNAARLRHRRPETGSTPSTWVRPEETDRTTSPTICA